MATKIQSDITVDMTVRVSVNSTWGENATIAQVHNDAKQTAENIIKKALTGKALMLSGGTVNVFSKEVKTQH